MGTDPAARLRELFQVAVAAADTGPAVANGLPEPPRGRVLVIGAGKAAAAMAAAVEAAWLAQLGRERLSGFVVVPDGHEAPTRRLEVLTAAHPVPDGRSDAAGARALAEAAELKADDLLLALVSGGGSSLLVAPAAGLSLADKQAAAEVLLAAGAPISAINAVRRRLSRIKGGRLALAAAPARVTTLLVSDVPGNDPATIASGPTVPASAPAPPIDAVLRGRLPAAVRRRLDEVDDAPLRADPRLSQLEASVVMEPAAAFAAVRERAGAWGWEVLDLGDRIEGPARLIGEQHAWMALRLVQERSRGSPPLLVLSGGETSVQVLGSGLGGRNTEYAAALALRLGGAPEVHAIAADTDGLDGVGGHAGALVRPETLARVVALGLDMAASLDANDTRAPFAALGDLIVTGPTRTNVNDFRAVLIEHGARPA